MENYPLKFSLEHTDNVPKYETRMLGLQKTIKLNMVALEVVGDLERVVH